MITAIITAKPPKLEPIKISTFWGSTQYTEVVKYFTVFIQILNIMFSLNMERIILQTEARLPVLDLNIADNGQICNISRGEWQLLPQAFL